MKKIFEIVASNLNSSVYNENQLDEIAWNVCGLLSLNDYKVSSELYNYLDSTWIDLRHLTQIEIEIAELLT